METENKSSLSNSLRTGEFFMADEKRVTSPWFGADNGEWFRCGYCGHKFVVGDWLRWIFTNDIIGASGNPLACQSCCGTKTREELREEWKKMCHEVKTKYWWFLR